MMKIRKLRYSLLLALSLTALHAQATHYPDLPVGIKNGTGTLIGDTLYVGLGSGGNQFYSLNLKQAGAQWQSIATFPGGERNQPISSAIDGKLYVLGGAQKNEKGELQLVNDAYRYDPQNNTWQKLPTRSPRGLVGASAVSYGKKIYIIGGVNDAIFNGYFQDYIAAGEDKTQKEAVISAYFNQQPSDYFFTPEIFSYEPDHNQWHNEGIFPFPARAGAAFSVNGNHLLVVNGEIKPGLRTASTEQGTITQQGIQWKKLPNLPAVKDQKQDGLAGAMGGYSHGDYLLAGGANFPGSTAQFNAGEQYAHKGLSKAWHNEIYRLNSKGEWKIIGHLPMGIAYGIGITYGNQIILIGGETEGNKALTAVKTISYDGEKLIIE